MHKAAVLCLLLMNEVTYLGIILHLPTCSDALLQLAPAAGDSCLERACCFKPESTLDLMIKKTQGPQTCAGVDR